MVIKKNKETVPFKEFVSFIKKMVDAQFEMVEIAPKKFIPVIIESKLLKLRIDLDTVQALKEMLSEAKEAYEDVLAGKFTIHVRSFSGSRFTFFTLNAYKPFNARDVENRLLHIVKYTPFKGYVVPFGRFTFDFTQLPVEMLTGLFDHIVTIDDPRTNKSWRRALQNLIIVKKLKSRTNLKLKSSRTGLVGKALPDDFDLAYGDVEMQTQPEKEFLGSLEGNGVIPVPTEPTNFLSVKFYNVPEADPFDAPKAESPQKSRVKIQQTIPGKITFMFDNKLHAAFRTSDLLPSMVSNISNSQYEQEFYTHVKEAMEKIQKQKQKGLKIPGINPFNSIIQGMVTAKKTLD